MANSSTISQRSSDLFFRSDKKQLPSLRQLNDSVYEFYSPPDGSVSLEIIFFHGVERGDYSKAYVEAWTSFLELESTVNCWPQTLLAEEFPGARILSVSYDSSIEKGPKQGNLDLYLTAENLVHDLIDAKVAAPLILVGKDFGGLVIKAICMKAKDQNRSTFLSNLKGIFYYGTPHLGVQNLPTAFNGTLAERLTFGNKEIARLGSNFCNYRKESKWATRAIICLQKSEKMPELVISEASQRYDVDEYYTLNKDIDTVCKSQMKTSSSFRFLIGLISSIEKGDLLFKSSPEQAATEEGFKTLLGFGNDGTYVPMETTLAEVKNALQTTHIVVLHGGPGSGKSSLARYLALQFEAVTQQQNTGVVATSSAEQSDWLPNGVVYITCGNGAETTSVQSELLRKFNIEVPLLQDKSQVLEGAAKLQKLLRDDLVEYLSKLQSRVLVVLDDVWDSPNLLENLLVPGDRVKYLLTTQISALWNACDSKKVLMQDVTLEDARHILGNYANFEGGVISKDLENLGDEIIGATGSHPLALATLGNVLNNMQRTVQDWQEVKGNLMHHLESKDYPPSSFGQKYPLSVDASMMVGLDLLDEDAKKLLYVITLLDGPFIPETLLQLFVTCTLSRDKEINYSTSKMSLVAKGFVRTEIETFGEKVTNPTSSSIGDDMRVIWIHSLRQHFILTTKTREIRRITNFLDFRISTYFLDKFMHLGERSNLDLAIALCALYGVPDIKKRAEQKMGFHFIQRHSRKLASALKPFVSLMLSEGSTKSPISQAGPISQAATKVFLKYVCKGELDDDKISYLLKSTTYPLAPLATLRALADIFEIEYFSIENVKLIHKDHLGLVSAIVSLLGSRDDAYRRIEEIQICACRALLYICAKAKREKSIAVLNVPDVLTVLVDLIQAALQVESGELSNQLAAYAVKILRVLSYDDSKDAKLKICNTEGLLVGLVGSLSAHYNRPLPEYAAAVLRNLASGDDVDIKLTICNAEGGLSGLAQSLSKHDNPHLQEWAARTLQNLAMDVASARKICDEPGSVLRPRPLVALVQSLSAPTNPALQRGAAFALANLAYHGVKFGLKICQEEGALSGLVKLLFQEENADVKGAGAFALRNLASTVQLEVANAEGAFEGLLRAMSQHDKPVLQESAMWALNNLAMAAGESMKLKFEKEEGAVADLMKLSKHKSPKLREPATRLVVTLGLGGRKRRWMKVHFLKCI